jgi:uncharacterized membrane protein AbrB (regulator of aidB expression)
MSTQYADEHTTRGYPQHEQRGGGGWGQSSRRRPKPFFATSEFLTLLAGIAAIAIAAAIADNFEAPRAWLLITILCGAYIVSRGLSKIGRGDGLVDRND